MNDRLNRHRQANPGRGQFRRSRFYCLAKQFFPSVALLLVFGLGAIAIFVNRERLAVGSRFSFSSLPFRGIESLEPNFSQILMSITHAERENRFEQLRAAGFIAVLGQLEYARALQDQEVQLQGFELLYHSLRSGFYIVSLGNGRAAKALSRIVGAAGAQRIRPNYYVTLQSLKLSRHLDHREPREVFQWYTEDWDVRGRDRFPLSLDQRYPELQLQRLDEMRSWIGDSGMLKPFTGNECASHLPLTTRAVWLRNWIEQPEANLPQSNSRSSEINLSLANESIVQNKPFEPFIILHDSMPDENHPELVGHVYHASNLGYSRGGQRVGDHGTHSAGVISAAQNQIGIAGISPGSPIVAFGFPSDEGDGIPRTSLRSLIPSLGEIKSFLDERRKMKKESRGVQIVHLSYSSEVQSREDAFALEIVLADLMAAHDVLIIVPAGNRSLSAKILPSFFAPADLSSNLNQSGFRGAIIPVGASDVCSRPAWFSNRAETAQGRTLYAPGQSIYSTLPNSDYGFMTGTSAAASMVSGIAFVLEHKFPLSENRNLQRTPAELKRLLLRSATELTVGPSNYLVDAYSLLDAVTQNNIIEPTSNASAKSWGLAQ